MEIDLKKINKDLRKLRHEVSYLTKDQIHELNRLRVVLDFLHYDIWTEDIKKFKNRVKDNK
tara:strand:+ start:207 stop:389 length:183 start_codon:yes stop_codon:yes gene_type:complete